MNHMCKLVVAVGFVAVIVVAEVVEFAVVDRRK